MWQEETEKAWDSGKGSEISVQQRDLDGLIQFIPMEFYLHCFHFLKKITSLHYLQLPSSLSTMES